MQLQEVLALLGALQLENCLTKDTRDILIQNLHKSSQVFLRRNLKRTPALDMELHGEPNSPLKPNINRRRDSQRRP